MLISVIIPYFNRANTIERCINSIDILNNPNIEVIIIDDGSIEKIPSTIKNINIYNHDKNKGPVAARITGLNLAKGKYVLFLDSDDELVIDWFNIITTTISNKNFNLYAFPDVKFYSNSTFIINSIESYWNWISIENRATDYILVFNRIALLNTNIEKLRISEVWLLCKFFMNNNSAFYSNIPLFVYHQDALNQLSKSKNFNFSINEFERKSLSYSISILKSNIFYINSSNKIFYYAWIRRFLKEAFLLFDINNVVKLLLIFFKNRK